MQVHLETLGCRLNEAELESWARAFRQQGHEISADIESADVVVVNTCAVTEEAVRKSRRLIRRTQNNNPLAKLVVSGCYATLNPSSTKEIPGVDLLVENRDKEKLPQLVAERINVESMPVIATEPGENTLFRRGRQRAFIKVQDGCRYKCTYCIVTEARGEERSRPVDEIIDEIKALHAEGVQEAVITGVHLGGYGSDIDTDLTALIKAVLDLTEIPRLRLGSLEPWDIPEGFWELFNNPRLMPHLHLPLQSGSDPVLRRMARRCRTEEFRLLWNEAMTAVPGLNITTDIIVGFPGETDMEWKESLDFLRGFEFGHMHIFAYSPRPGTKAERLPEPVPEEIKKERSRELRRIAETMKAGVLEKMIGHTVDVLIENRNSIDGREWYFGYTPNYLRVRIPAEPESELENSIVGVAIDDLNVDSGVLTGILP